MENENRKISNCPNNPNKKRKAENKNFKRFSSFRLASFYKCKLNFFDFTFYLLLFIFYLFPAISNAQKIAVITPDKNSQSQIFAENIEKNLPGNFKITDNSLSETAFNSVIYEKPFNLTTNDSKNIGVRIGCDYFVLIKSDSLRRYSFAQKEFYESYAAIFVVSSRTGHLIFWKIVSREGENIKDSNKFLLDSAKDLSREIAGEIQKNRETKTNKTEEFEELPEANSPAAKNFRPPLPYNRIRPEYTAAANLYSVEATVDILVDVDENGEILQTEIVRWAGFGLDESVAETVRKMNWKPASRDGENLPIRVLLRYNFKKIEDK